MNIIEWMVMVMVNGEFESMTVIICICVCKSNHPTMFTVQNNSKKEKTTHQHDYQHFYTKFIMMMIVSYTKPHLVYATHTLSFSMYSRI